MIFHTGTFNGEEEADALSRDESIAHMRGEKKL